MGAGSVRKYKLAAAVRGHGSATGTARPGPAKLGMAWQGTARSSKKKKMGAGLVRKYKPGVAWLGVARPGMAWHGEAKHGVSKKEDGRRISP